ncbi:MAG: hypothetical protein IPN84_04060 [Sphingomonadales bacterium]|jgi:hypothetical protein|nr:hypothetical protein [Sphingomonadales bacterium]
MFRSKQALCATLAIIAALVPATAQATCWSEDAADAAAVRDMETMLMVGALRCRGESQAIITHYNGFIRANRAALTHANDRLRAYFTASGSGLNGYDRYVTSLANRYGGGDGLTCQQIVRVIDFARTGDGSYANLSGLAQDLRIETSLPGGRCAQQVARR